MRYLLTVLLLGSLALAQGGMGGNGGVGGKGGIGGGTTAAGCTTPTGTHVTESWGDSSTSCWAAGPSSCNNTWTIGLGTAQSIITSPAGAPANTACSNSLQMNVPAANDYLSLAYSAISTNFDMTGTFYVNTFPTSGNRVMMLCIGNTNCNSGNDLALVVLDNNNVGSGTTVYGGSFGSGSNSTPQSITTATWYTFDLHWDTTAANCSFVLNGGAAHTFTCSVNGTTTNLAVVGPYTFGVAAQFVIGNMAW